MVAWRVAKCLLTLKGQWQTAHPGAANPGFIGDAEHATRTSDHNPWVDDPTSLVNVVTAGDFYHQPTIGADAYELAEALKQGKDPRVKYVISRRRIWSLARDREGWRPYYGVNPHTGHTHVSVTSSYPLYDSTRPWDITTQEDDMPLTDADKTWLTDMVDRKIKEAVGTVPTAQENANAVGGIQIADMLTPPPPDGGKRPTKALTTHLAYMPERVAQYAEQNPETPQ